MRHLPLLLLAALGFAAEEAPRPAGRPDTEGPRREGRPESRPRTPLSPDEQKRLDAAFEKAKQDPKVKKAQEQATKAQQTAQEAQRKAREVTEDAARKADPEIAPLLEKLKQAMERRQPEQPGRPPEGPPRGDAPRRPQGQPEQPGPGQADDERPRGDVREPGPGRGDLLPGLSPDEQRRVREALAKANANPAVRAAREDAAAAQRKAMEIAEDVARQADPSIAPLLEKMRRANENRRPDGENPRGRKPE